MLVGCHGHEREGAVLEPHEGDRLDVGAGTMQIYVDAETHPHARAGFVKFSLDAGQSLPVHKHTKTEEFAYFLSGEGEAVMVDADGRERVSRVAAEYVWYVAPGQWHTIRNPGDEPLVLVFAVVPNEKQGLISFFRRIGVEPGKEGVALSRAEFERIASEHDLILREE